MANPRAEIPIVVLSDESPTSPVAGATATVKNRGSGEAAIVYSDSGTTNNTVSQPLSTDSAGRLTGWLPRGAYQVEITVSGKTPYTEYLDVAPGSDGGVDASWIASEAVETGKIKNSAITAGKIGPEAVENSKIKEGAVTAAKLGGESVETAKIKNLAVATAKVDELAITEAKIAAGAVTLVKLAANAKPVTWYTPKIIATEESRTNTAYGVLATADEIKEVVLPENGQMIVTYQALWKGSANFEGSGDIAEAAIFLNANQLKEQAATAPIGDVAKIHDEGIGTDTTNKFQSLSTGPTGLTSSFSATAYGAFVTTGMLATSIKIFAAPSTYTISVQFKASSGTVTVKERKLWVEVHG